MVFSKLIIAVTFLSVFGWSVKHITLGDKDFGFLTTPIEELSGFPDLFKQSVKEVKTLPGTFIKTPEDFTPINLLKKDIKVVSAYSNEQGNRTVDLLNLRNNEVLFSWEIILEEPFAEHDRVMDPLMLSDSSLCYSFNGGSGLIKIDSLSKVIWKQDSIIHHHSLNVDSDGNIWACAYQKEEIGHLTYQASYNLGYHKTFFLDDLLVKVDPENGKILYKKSLTEILIENNLVYLIIKSGSNEDPFHINDIQPSLKTTKYYNKGDLFISSRNLSCIIHFRPVTNEVVDVIEGPFSCQHDVDFYGDKVLAFFNNNNQIDHGGSNSLGLMVSKNIKEIGDCFSHITKYNLETKEFEIFEDSLFRSNRIFTYTEGGQEFIDENTVFIEEQNTGLLWVFKDGAVVYKDVLHSHIDGYHHLPNWIRLIE